MSEISEFAIKLEKDVIRLLEEFQFKDVNGGRNFKIINTQVDACGGFEDYLLVLECYSKKKNNEEEDIREKLKIFRGDLDCIRHAVNRLSHN